MPVEERHDEVYEFGEFRLEAAERRLSRAGEPVALPPKAFDMLLMLVRHNGSLLTKQELFDRLWPGTVVEETNLTTYVSVLRKALGANADGRATIQTVPRHGYRFQADVRLVEPAKPSPPLVIERYSVTEVVTEEFDPPDLPPEALAAVIDVPAVRISDPPPAGRLGPAENLPASPAAKPWYRRGPIPVLVLLSVVVGLGAAFIQMRNRSSEGLSLPPRLIPLTNLPGDKCLAAFSPDGRQVAFAADKLGTRDWNIYVTQVGGLDAKQITDDPAPETRPVWSPDGRYLAFLREKNSSQEIIVKSLDLGTERSLGVFAGGLSWSPDGHFLAVQEKSDKGDVMWVSLLDIDTGIRRRVTDPPVGYEDHRPVFSSDGRQLAFLRRLNRMGNIFVVPISGGTPRQVTFGAQRLDSLAWLPDGREILFASDRSGVYLIWRVSAAGGEPRLVAPVTGKCDEVAIDPTGTRLIYRQSDASSSLWKLESTDIGGEGETRIVRPAVPVVRSTQLHDSPSFSPDGKRLAFSSDQTGTKEIWTCAADGSRLVRLTHFNKGVVGTPRWSPDGKFIVFDADENERKRIYIVPAEGGTPRPVTDGKEFENLPFWSHDGRWIYFCVHRADDHQIWKIPSGGGTPVQVTFNGGWECAESPDGTRLYYTKGRNVAGIWELDLASGNETPIPESAEVVGKRYWAVTTDGIVFAAPDPSGTWIIKLLNLKTRRIKSLASMLGLPVEWSSGLAVSPDRTMIVYTQNDQFGGNLTMVENFR